MLKAAKKEQLDEIIALASKRKSEILNTASVFPTDGTIYYFDAENGSDNNDGLTPETALKTPEIATNLPLNKGDAVLFRRGQVFRGLFKTQEGVTYSAYGEGKKPEILGSVNAGNPEDWEETEYKNVWKFKNPIHHSRDIGAIFMKNDELWGIKVCVNPFSNERCDMGNNTTPDVFNGRKTVHRERGIWSGIEDLRGDLEFWHDWETGFVYLNCPDGNPAIAFGTVEMTQRVSIITPKEWGQKDVTLDNLTLKYGNFGVSGFGDSVNFTVRNCVFGCIGGSTQFVEALVNKDPAFKGYSGVARLGNGIEVYGVCEGFTVENCYFYQNYDAAVTVQVGYEVAERDFVNENTRWINNLFDTCHYCFELWLTIADSNGFRHELNNTDISNNICLNCGYGWAHQRPDPGYAFYYGGSEAAGYAKFTNCSMHDNYLVNGKRYLVSCWHIGGTKMQMENNKIFHNNSFGSLRENFDESIRGLTTFSMSKEDIETIEKSGFIGENEYYTFDETYIPEDKIIKF